MSNSDDSMHVVISGDVAGLKDSMRDGAEAVDRSAQSMLGSVQHLTDKTGTALSGLQASTKTALGGVTEAFERIQSPLMAIGALIGGGALFKEGIATANALNGEAMKLARTLNITGTEAATLRTALGDIYSDTDTYVGAFQKFAGMLRKNEDGMKAMGIQTRDGNGHLRDSNTLFREALSVVGTYKPGLDQTTAAMTLFGKGVDDVMKLQKLNNDVLEDAKAKNQELGMTLTKEGVEATKKYKAAMNDVGDVFEALKNAIGVAVMPVFTELGTYFASTGPYVLGVFKGALTGVVVAFRVVQGAVQTVSGVIFEAISTIVDGAGLLGDVFSKLMKGDFSGAASSAKDLGTRIGQSFRNAYDNFISVGDETERKVKSDLDRIWGKGTEVAAPKGGSNTMGDFKNTNGGDKGKPRTAEWEAELALEKETYEKSAAIGGSFREYSKAQEAEFWNQIRQRQGLSREEQAAVDKKYYSVVSQSRKQAFEAELADLNAQKEELGKNYKGRIDIAEQAYTKIAAAYGAESKEAKVANSEILKEKQKLQDQVDKINQEAAASKLRMNLAQTDADRDNDKAVAEMAGATAEQLLAIDASYLERRKQLEVAAAQADLQNVDPEKDPEKYQQLLDRKLELEQQYQLKSRALRTQAQAAGLQPLNAITASTENAFSQSLQGMMKKTMTFGQAVRNVYQGMRDAVIKSIADMLAAKVMAWGKEKLMTAMGIGADAAKAGAGAAASQASIPIIGPGLALAAMAATFASVGAMAGKVPSARAGMVVPRGVNPMAQIHEEEMVLPASISKPLTDALSSGNGLGGDTHNWNFHGYNSRELEDLLMRRGGADVLVKAIKDRQRNGGLTGGL